MRLSAHCKGWLPKLGQSPVLAKNHNARKYGSGVDSSTTFDTHRHRLYRISCKHVERP